MCLLGIRSMKARTTAFVPIFGPGAGDVNLYEGFPLHYNCFQDVCSILSFR
jgi:hypothetical protein